MIVLGESHFSLSVHRAVDFPSSHSDESINLKTIWDKLT